MDQQKDSLNESKIASRRKFITKVGAASLVTIVPSKTAWATNCTVSGNLSNMGSGVEQCESSTIVFNGRSGGFWRGAQQLKTHDGRKFFKNAGKVASAFDSLVKIGSKIYAYEEGQEGVIENSDTLAQACWYIRRHIRNETSMHPNVFPISGSLLNALKGGGYEKQLASAYLNAYFGFYQLPSGVTAKGYVESLDDQVINNIFSDEEMMAAIEKTHTDGVIPVFPY